MKTIPKTDIIRFTGKGQAVIPRWLRNELDIEEGTRALVYQEGDAVMLKAVAPRHIRNLLFSLKGSGLLKALVDDWKRERELK
jgi:bifunctional DNA-binding transcriptional regulator/antitoxin component of YhaV-PrlF toxin-antitoxin module